MNEAVQVSDSEVVNQAQLANDPNEAENGEVEQEAGCCGRMHWGPINDRYRSELSKTRPAVEAAHERLLCFKAELDRDSNRSNEHKARTLRVLGKAYGKLNRLLFLQGLNIPPAERETIRCLKEEMEVCRGWIEDHSLEPVTPGSVEAERFLVSHLTATMDGQCFRVVQTFTSASLGVIYPSTMAPLTLALTMASGILGILEDVLVKGSTPKQLTVYRNRTNRVAPMAEQTRF